MTNTTKAPATVKPAPTKTITTTIEGKGRPKVAELVQLLQELDNEATVVGLATLGGQQRPEWRVSVESTRPAVQA